MAIGSEIRFSGNPESFIGTAVVRWDDSGAVTELPSLGLHPPGGYSNGDARAINDAGIGVGTEGHFGALDNYLGSTAVRWDATGSANALGGVGSAPAGGYVEAGAVDINNAGEILGVERAFDADANLAGSIGVKWDSAGTPTALGPLGTPPGGGFVLMEPKVINASGQAVGQLDKVHADFSYESQHAVRWDSTGVASELVGLGVADDSVVSVSDLNDAGIVVGYESADLATPLALRWDAAGNVMVLSTFAPPPGGANNSIAWSINDAGFAAGAVEQINSQGNSDFVRAVYWNPDGTVVDLNTLIDPTSGWELNDARAISDTGWIAGIGQFDPDGPGGAAAYSRGFLMHVPATVVPEPASFVMLLIASVSAAVSRRPTRRPRNLFDDEVNHR